MSLAMLAAAAGQQSAPAAGGVVFEAADADTLGGTLSFDLGTAPDDGDLLVLFWGSNNNEAATVASAGFTVVSNEQDDILYFGFAYRVASGESSTRNFGISNSAGTLHRYSGVDTGAPIDDWDYNHQTSNVVYQSVAGTDGGMWVASLVNPYGFAVDDPGGSWTQAAEDSGGLVVAYYLPLTATGSTTTVTLGGESNPHSTYSVAVAPA